MFWQITIADVGSALLSGIAVIVSIVALRSSDTANQTSLRSNNCSKIFDEYLMKGIPESRIKLNFAADGLLHHGNQMCDVLSEMMFSALFYRYDDNKFFYKLQKACNDLEDVIVEAGNHPIPSELEQKTFYEDLQNRLESIYGMIDDKRIGKA